MAMKYHKNKQQWTLDSKLLLAIRNSDLRTASELFASGVDSDTKFHPYKKPAVCLCVENNDFNMGKFCIIFLCIFNHLGYVYTAQLAVS